ncbi:MAG TPA: DUF2207 domain-containing protein [Woeseiaceae bacterium]|nr:DUF2207 domain-containing protein [Woeseiaceae bacterium]
MRKLWFVLAWLSLCSAAAQADERILSFASDILVLADGDIQVTETIRVRAEGDRIQRGIYRDQFTDYKDSFGNRFVTRLVPQSVLRDGDSEDFHTVAIERGQRTYFGHRERLLPHGEHVYEYRYRVSRVLGFFADHDELYWTVTGFDWAFPIDKASARVRFDFDVPMDEVKAEAYTGPFGAQEQNFFFRKESGRSIYFESTKPLSPVNGLTIVVSWPKGLVAEPTSWQRFGWLIADNLNLIVALAGFGLLLIYYIPVWRGYGKDPEEGPLVTRYEPPQGFSPASLRYINQMYYDDKVMTAAILNLAVKGYLRINHHDNAHSLTQLDPGTAAPALAPGEQELYDGLFRGGRAVKLEKKNHALLGKAKLAHRNSLQDDYKYKYFQTNTYLNIPGVVIVLGTMAAALLLGGKPSLPVIVVIGLMILTLVFFAIQMKRPTMRGRALLDELQGFRDYLDVAEKDELNLRNPPEKTPALFETYLPYALALGVDQAWAEKFAAVLAAVRGPDGQAYQPGWYSGTWSSSNILKSTSSLSSGLSSAVTSSVTPPGSSSGGGGGGSSGGGGGGGGGGGW